jgi:hypothetical protein
MKSGSRVDCEPGASCVLPPNRQKVRKNRRRVRKIHQEGAGCLQVNPQESAGRAAFAFARSVLINPPGAAGRNGHCWRFGGPGCIGRHFPVPLPGNHEALPTLRSLPTPALILIGIPLASALSGPTDTRAYLFPKLLRAVSREKRLGVFGEVRAREAGRSSCHPQDLLLWPTCCLAAPAGGNDPLRRRRLRQHSP